jgi:hypothetical protein
MITIGSGDAYSVRREGEGTGWNRDSRHRPAIECTLQGGARTASRAHKECRAPFLLLAVTWHLGDLHRDIMAHCDIFHKQLAATSYPAFGHAL